MRLSAILHRRWWERSYLDLWSVPHLAAGLLMAAAAVYWGLSAWLGLGLAVSAAVAWEVFEHLTGISDVEPLSNKISDIVVGSVGYGLGRLLFGWLLGTPNFVAVILALAALDAVMTALGIASYWLYGGRASGGSKKAD